MLGALSLTGCRGEAAGETSGPDSEVKTQTLTFKASGAQATNDDITKTVMQGDKASGFSTAWTAATDKLGVYSYNAASPSGELTMNAEFGITSVTDGVATFEGQIRYGAADMTFDIYAYYPRNNTNNFQNSTYDNVSVVVEYDQTMPANGTHDPANDLMVALPGQQVTVTGGQTLNASLDELEFRYLVGFMNLTIRDITAAGITADDVVESVKITADAGAKLAGEFTLDLSDGGLTNVSSENEITVTVPAEVTLGNLNLWAVVNPFSTENLKFLITTETHSIEKTVSLPGFSIAAAGIKTFDMAIDDNCVITSFGGTLHQFDGYYNSVNTPASWGGGRVLTPVITSTYVTLGNMTDTGFATSGGSPAANSWGTNGWIATVNADQTAPTVYATFTVDTDAGNKISFTECNINIRRSGTGPADTQVQYKIGTGAFQTAFTWNAPGTTNAGNKLTFNLSTITALKDIEGGQTITFRLVPYGGTGSAGTWYLIAADATERSFGIKGTVLVP